MTTGPGEGDLAAKFLGVQGNARDPRVLLGVGAGPVTDQAVISALRGRIAQVSEHPEANSVEADEVRLALHAAAARLLDPATRKRIAEVAERTDAAQSVQANLLTTLGMYGGWNKEAMRRAAMLARAQGVEPDRLFDLVRELTQGTPSAGGPSAPATRRELAGPAGAGRQRADASFGGSHLSESRGDARDLDSTVPLPEQMDPAGRNVRNVMMFAGIGIGVLCVVTVTGVILFSSPGAPPAPAPIADATGGSSPTAASQQRTPEYFPAPASSKSPEKSAALPQPNSDRLGDFGDVLRELSICNAGLEIDPEEALKRFELVSRQLAARWIDASPDGQVAAASAQVEFVYRCGAHEERSARALGAIADPSRVLGGSGPSLIAEQIAPAVWSAGMVTRLLGERDLSSDVRSAVREAFGATFAGSQGPGENTFRSGAIAALTMIPARVLPAASVQDEPEIKRSAEAWKSWIRSIQALDGKDGSLRQRLLVQSLERLLTDGAEPMAHRPTYDGITQLTLALTWRKGEDSRAALLRWFDNPRVSNADLHTITGALATRSGAEGVDYAMVLSLAGGEAGRAELRERFATVWGLTGVQSRDQLVESWLEKSRVGQRSSGQTWPVERLAAGVALARLNECAAMLWAGETAEVADILALEPPQAVLPGNRHGNVPWTVADSDVAGSSWAVRYLGAGANIPQRREILTGIVQAPSPLEADVLVEEAVRGSPVQVRQDARREVIRWAGEASIVNAMLELAPMMPVTHESTDLIRTVSQSPMPGPRDPSWRVAARRALVERLLQVIADSGATGQIDSLAAELAETYRGRLTRSGKDRQRGDGGAAPVEIGARALRQRLERDAESLIPTGREPSSLRDLEVRRAARVRVASGRVQLFAAEQAGVCELFAFIVANERPQFADAVADVLAELDDRRRSANHVFEQVEAGERAMLRLWRLRFGEVQE